MGAITEIPYFRQDEGGLKYNPRSLTVAELTDAIDVMEAESDATIPPNDIRPHIKDANTGKWCLWDTGATLSIWPRSEFPGAKPDLRPRLKAVNATKIATYGVKTLKVRFGPSIVIEHSFILVDLARPIIGFDIMDKNGLNRIQEGRVH